MTLAHLGGTGILPTRLRCLRRGGGTQVAVPATSREAHFTKAAHSRLTCCMAVKNSHTYSMADFIAVLFVICNGIGWRRREGGLAISPRPCGSEKLSNE